MNLHLRQQLLSLHRSDSGTSTETTSIAITVNDSGTSTETSFVNRPVGAVDTGTAIDLESLHAYITVTDTGTDSETAFKRTAVALLVSRIHTYRHWTYEVSQQHYQITANKHVTVTGTSKPYAFRAWKHTTPKAKELVYR